MFNPTVSSATAAPEATSPASRSRDASRPTLVKVCDAISRVSQQLPSSNDNDNQSHIATNILLSELHSILNSYFSAPTLHLGYAYEQRASSFRYKWKAGESYVSFSEGPPF